MKQAHRMVGGLVAALALLEPAYAADAPNFGTALVKMLAALGLVLGLFALAIYFLKRTGVVTAGGQRGELQVERMISVGYRNRVAIVRAGERRLLVGITANSVNRLADLTGENDTGRREESS